MDADSGRCYEVTPSSLAHERAALEYVRELLPDRHPSQVFLGLASLPSGLDLARLLRLAGFELNWDVDRLIPPQTGTASSSWRSPATAGAAGPAPVGPGAGPDVRLQYALRHGGVRMVTVRRSRWAGCRDHLGHVAGTEPVDASAAFVAALPEAARERQIADFAVVLRADAPNAKPRARLNLERVVAQAWTRPEAGWNRVDVLVLDALTPFGRYAGGMALLDRLLDRARRAGRDDGPRTVVLLCPAQDEQQAPRTGTEAVGLTSGDEWIVAPSRCMSKAAVA